MKEVLQLEVYIVANSFENVLMIISSAYNDGVNIP